MSETPERIYAWPWNGENRRGQWTAFDWVGEIHELTTYLRADIADEILEALKDIATCVEDGCFTSEMRMASAVDNARAAIAKAEGENT